MPSHWIPVQVDDHADFQASKEISLGSETKFPVLISSKDFNDVVTMIKSGNR